MVSLVLLLFLLGGVCSQSQHLKDGTRERQHSFDSQIDSRMEQLERVILQQAAKLSHLETLLRQQSEKLSQQEKTLFEYGNLPQTITEKNMDNLSELKEHHSANVEPQKPELKLEISQTLWENRSLVHGKARPRTPPAAEMQQTRRSRADDSGAWEVVVAKLSQQMTEVEAEVQTLKNTDSQHSRDIQDAQTSTFTQWGSSTCGGDSQLVYPGFVGGSHFTHKGAATNYLCLTRNPIPSNLSSGTYGLLYGGEYETHDTHQNRDPVCAVCRAAHSTTVMIPGTNVCTPGWHLQYSGYLMAGYYDHVAGSEYICVDGKLESTVHGEQSQDGKLLYFVKTRCGSLPCTPYVNDKVVTCAVCSR